MSSNIGIPFATNMGALTVTSCESAARYICVLATLSMMHVSVGEIPIYMLCEFMFQPTVAVNVSRQTMPVDGASTTKCAVVFQIAALMKLTGYRLVIHSYHVYPCVYFYVC